MLPTDSLLDLSLSAMGQRQKKIITPNPRRVNAVDESLNSFVHKPLDELVQKRKGGGMLLFCLLMVCVWVDFQ